MNQNLFLVLEYKYYVIEIPDKNYSASLQWAYLMLMRCHHGESRFFQYLTLSALNNDGIYIV